ncbi:MAG: matrixin family metalloprotease [Bacteriovoracaceae bacterium]|nr:matrixin family metalloprotease [Bacteriovoracaceae bacterium]
MNWVFKFLLLSIHLTPLFAFTCPTESLVHQKSTVMTDEQGNARIWSEEDRHNLTYCISNRFKELKPTIISALETATKDWMQTANVRFEYVPETDITCDNKLGPQTLFSISINTSRRYPYAGRAFFPYDERNTVTFKKSYVEGGYEELLRLTRHELGHVLGLRHEHIREENPNHESCTEDDLFKPVTGYDSSSIMHYARCGGTGSKELSKKDLEGIALLYP